MYLKKQQKKRILPCFHFIEHVARDDGDRGWRHPLSSRWRRSRGGWRLGDRCSLRAMSRGAVPRRLGFGSRRRRAALCGCAFPLWWRDGQQRCAGACPRRYEEGASGSRPCGSVPGATARVWRDRWRDCAGVGSGGGERSRKGLEC
jgi:hypothetical protein